MATETKTARPTQEETAAIYRLFQAYQELRRLGWKDAIYCPKDGRHFWSIEVGSTGIHDTNYDGEWPKGSWWIFDGDIWPARPVLFKEKEARADPMPERSQEWQPIETAPKDGTRILLVTTYGAVIIGSWRDLASGQNCQYFPGWQIVDCDDCFYSGAERTASYWMPLPAPPTDAEGR